MKIDVIGGEIGGLTAAAFLAKAGFAEKAIPGLRVRATLIMPGTSATFQRFTRRREG